MRELLILYFFAGILHCIAAASNCLDLSGDPTFNDVKNCKEIKGKGYVTVKIGQVDENEWSSFSMNLEQLQYVNMRIENSSVKTVYFLRLQSARQCSWFIENNPSLEEIEINARGPAATSYLQLYFSNNPSLTSVKFETNGQADFKIDGLAVVFEYNMALKTITLPDNSVKSLDELKIEGNPLLSKASLQYFKNLNTGTISNYVQDEGECVFAEEISDLGKLTPCKYVKGDLNLAKDVTGSAGSTVLSQVDGKVFLKDPKMDQLGFLIGTNVTGGAECQFSQEVANLNVLTLCSEVKGDLNLASGVKGSTGSHLLKKVNGDVNLKDAKENQLGFLKNTTVTGQTTGSCITTLYGNPVKKKGICPAGSATTADPKDSSKSKSTESEQGNEGAGFFSQNLVPISVGAAVVTLLILVATGIFIYCRFFKKKKTSKKGKDKKAAPGAKGTKVPPAAKGANVTATVTPPPAPVKKRKPKKVRPPKPPPEPPMPLELPLGSVYDPITMTNQEQWNRLKMLAEEILTFNPLEFLEVCHPLKYQCYMPRSKDTRGKRMAKEYETLLAKYWQWRPDISVIQVPMPDEREWEDEFYWGDERQILWETILCRDGLKKLVLCLWSTDDLETMYPTMWPYVKMESKEEIIKCREEEQVERDALKEERRLKEEKAKEKYYKEIEEMRAADKKEEEEREKRAEEERVKTAKEERKQAGKGKATSKTTGKATGKATSKATSKATNKATSTTGKATSKATGKAKSTTNKATPTTSKMASTTSQATPTTSKVTPATSKMTSTTSQATPTTSQATPTTTATVSREAEPPKPTGPKIVEAYQFEVDQGDVTMDFFGKVYGPPKTPDEGMVTVYPFYVMKRVTGQKVIREKLSFVTASAWPYNALGEDKYLTFRVIHWARNQIPEKRVYMLVDEIGYKEECALLTQCLYDCIMDTANLPPITFLGACRLITARGLKTWDNVNMLLFLQRNLLYWAVEAGILRPTDERLVSWDQIYRCMLLRSQGTPSTRVYDPDNMPCPRDLWPVALRDTDDKLKRANIKEGNEEKYGIWLCEMGRATPEPLTTAGRLGEPEPALGIDKPLPFRGAWGQKCVQDGGPPEDSTTFDDQEDDVRYKYTADASEGVIAYALQMVADEARPVMGNMANAKLSRSLVGKRLPEEIECSDGLMERELGKWIRGKYAGKEFKGFRLGSDFDNFAYTAPMPLCEYVRPFKRPIKRERMDEGRFNVMAKMAQKEVNSFKEPGKKGRFF